MFLLYVFFFRFYDNIFPVVFQNLLSDPSAISVSSEYKKCLMSVRPDLSPKPFGSVPVNLGISLSNSAHAARLLLTKLTASANIFDLTSQWSVSAQCSESLTQLVTCAACHGAPNVEKPCRSFCTNVMSGCLAGVNDIDILWTKLVDKLFESHRMMEHDNLEIVLYQMHMNISDSLLHALETTHKYYPQVSVVLIFCTYIAARTHS